MEQCDVLIVGGGPAGSSLAWGLRDAGLRVMILDKQSFPRNKVCAGWITPAVLESLNIDGEHYRREHTMQAIHGFRISRMQGREVETTLHEQPLSFGIRRFEFDHYLLQRCGATVVAEPFRELTRSGTDWVINGRYQASLLVGAGGHFCPVARQLGARPGTGEITVAAQEIEFPMSAQQQQGCHIDGRVPELFFCADLKGYGWAFRKGAYLNIGLGREDQHRLTEHVKAFCGYLRDNGKIAFDLPVKFNGHAYLLYNHSRRKLDGDGVILIGDAAGLAYPQSGEGIRPAIESGLIAAAVVREAGGDYRSSRLAGYRDRIMQRYGKRPAAREPLNYLPAGLKRILAGGLLSTRWFVEHTVINQWFLHHHQAPLTAER
jgi:geranylgeranyl reductase family protein